jgi:LmbE family N-acetylglucosaminyl deacetylase
MARMLVVVAHPDDETFGTGSTIAFAAAAGHEVVVCCATRGEAGEDVSGTCSSAEHLAEVREGELRTAARILGAREVVCLDFIDSDMDGEPPPYSLVAVPLEAVVRPLVEVVRRVQPDVMIAFDPSSVKDHRDHVRIGEAATRAFELAAPEHARLYHWVMPRSAIEAWQKEMGAQGLREQYVEMELGRPDDEITTIIDVSSVYDTRVAAISEHRTQLSPWAGLTEDVMQTFLCRDYFVRAVPEWNGGPIETSLWAEHA